MFRMLLSVIGLSLLELVLCLSHISLMKQFFSVFNYDKHLYIQSQNLSNFTGKILTFWNWSLLQVFGNPFCIRKSIGYIDEEFVICCKIKIGPKISAECIFVHLNLFQQSQLQALTVIIRRLQFFGLIVFFLDPLDIGPVHLQLFKDCWNPSKSKTGMLLC